MTEEDSHTKDIEFKFDASLPPLLPPGDHYVVAFVRAEQQLLWGKRRKLFMHFKVVSPAEHAGAALFLAANVAHDGKWGIGFKFYRLWALAAGYRPKRKDRLSTTVFRGKYFKARVKTVEVSSKNTKRALAAQYSIVDELLTIEAGA
ncbi:MAG: hypothetical protein OEU68_07325 [Nitrospira sp.]|nr:hypothetical protein [Nitrospira sp.]MDH4245034.1 hypothetical protein [Nitrospira sp.]MDH4355961.1 hypothetical protein [Nitrospira sp.]MDH5319365.1 hypothetical protein [Nitrospira sp.]